MRFLTTLVFCYLGLSCSSDQTLVKPDPDIDSASSKKEELTSQQRLEQSTPMFSRKYVEDIYLMIEADELFEQKNHKRARENWQKVVVLNREESRREALNLWLKTHPQLNESTLKDNGSKTSSAVIKQMNVLKMSPALKELKLDSPEKLYNYLVKNFYPVAEKPPKESDPILPPESKGIPKNDRLLSMTAKSYCAIKGPVVKEWKSWVRTLKKNEKKYWQALTDVCLGKPEAVSQLEALIKPLSLSKRTVALAIHAAQSVAIRHRHNASRHKAAQTFKLLVETWQKPYLKAKLMGWTESKFMLEKINDHLWAARYRTLIGDYDSGLKYTELCLKDIAKAYPILEKEAPEELKELIVYQAEAYHIQAFRIAAEVKNLKEAYLASLKALEISSLNADWKARLLWFAGLYRYISEDYQNAIVHWNELEKVNPHGYLEPQIWFWLAKAYQNLDQSEEKDLYVEKLLSEYPLSFYSVIALEKAKLDDKRRWMKPFEDLRNLENRLSSSNLNLEFFRKDRTIAPQLKRTEILVNAQIKPWTNKAINVLKERLTEAYPIEKYPDIHVYLSRFYYVSGDYFRTIVETTKIAKKIERFWYKFPEQMLVYFPKPFFKIYQDKALSSQTDYKLLYAISRQESAFNPQAKSSANALGLMQLILPTAYPYAKQLGLKKSQLKKELLTPETSVAIGSLYLKELENRYQGFKPAMYAAYNAGEFAVNTWLEKRRLGNTLVWIELIPFGETKGYVKNVWRNLMIYQYLSGLRVSSKNYSRALDSDPLQGVSLKVDHYRKG